MENKRKASGASGIENGADTPDRTAKRRKLQEEFGDLTKGETSKSTTAYGHSILESIRSTTDKNGRKVAPFFEKLPSKADDPEYYKKIRLPLSLQLIERKLNKHEYPTLSSLEGDFKRLVSNAKETNSRQSEVFSDSERVRKAVSNLMVKHNPAYKTGNYQAVATPLPPSPGPDEADEEEDDAPGEEDDEEAEATPTKANGKAAAKTEDGEEEGPDEDEDEDEDEDDEDGDDEPEPTPIGGKRRRGGRSSRNAATSQASRSASSQAKGLETYDAISFEGLTFQQAQEKIVGDVLGKKDDNDYNYFEAFIYLPARSLKDYYEIIAEPMSLKALHKQVRGQHGRTQATGVSDFKSWAAFEDQASLIWKNAYHYNEDGSEIFVMAQELEEYMKGLISEAKQHVQEPPQQQKIKLKVQNTERPAQTPVHPKKITIHVGGKGSAAASPAPATSQTGDSESTRNGTPIGQNPFSRSNAAPVNPSQLEKARSVSISGASPSPSTIVAPAGAIKPEETAKASPAMSAQVNSLTTQQQFAPLSQSTPPPALPPAIAQLPPPPKLTAADVLEAQKYRPRPIKDFEALMPRLIITSHPQLQLENRLGMTIPASTSETQQEFVFNAPASYYRLQLRPLVAPFLEAQQREWKLNVMHDFTRVYPSSVERRNEPVFDVNLRYGSNRLEVNVVAASPKGEKGPHGVGMEMERLVIHFNLLKHH
ncbi:Bromodomain-containing protein [Apiospora kogelbergensis]|uniref:Bromodomain-containing protein n=1 Tax=Apiospora kogelbergensis TaxID=1337665 RepID=A0AAW0RD98_9PEZI